jgi:hypothetical protein
MTAMQEFVVPKSMPNTFAIKFKIVVYRRHVSAMTMPPTQKQHKLAANKGRSHDFRRIYAGRKTAPFATGWHTQSGRGAVWAAQFLVLEKPGEGCGRSDGVFGRDANLPSPPSLAFYSAS